MKVWDAIVVGAGPAGCAAAYDLAIAGLSVLLLDRAEFPRQKACAGGLTTKTVEALRYSIEPVVRQKLARIRIERDADRSTFLGRRADYCFMTVRQELDHYCLLKTIAAGAQFQRIRGISKITENEDHVEISFDGQILHAHYLIGADGVHSSVRRLAEETHGKSANWFWRGFALEAHVQVENATSEDLVFDFAPVHEGYGWIFPKGDHINVGLYSYSTSEKIDRARLSAYIRDHCGDVAIEEIIGQYAGFGAARHKILPSRVFLAGDAGGFVDPLTGEGIYFAVVSGQAAAEAVQFGIQSGAAAHLRFAEITEKLRANLAVSTSAASWFYGHLDEGYRLLTAPLLKRAALRAFADGFDVSQLARRVKNSMRVKNLMAVRLRRDSPPHSLLN